MDYALCLLLDTATETAFTNIINAIADSTAERHMADAKIPPHITIAFFQTEQIEHIIETLNENISTLPMGEIVWASLGAFVPHCIFAAPVMTDYLQNACVNANRLVAPFSQPGDGGHYLPGQWIPHTALSVKLTPEGLKTAFDITLRHFRFYMVKAPVLCLRNVIRSRKYAYGIWRKKVNKMIEQWDLYDENRQPLNRTITRGEQKQPGEYHTVVEIWTINSGGEILVTLRDPRKLDYPDKWENTGGSAIAGETSRQGAVRELREETGIVAVENELILLGTYKEESAFVDVYILKRNFQIEDIVLQAGEIVDAKWITRDTLDEMIADLSLALPTGIRFNHFRKEFERMVWNIGNIVRHEVSEELALSGIVEAGGFIYLSFCVGNVGQSVEAQINGAFDHLEKRLRSVSLNLESVIKIDALFRDVWNIPVMEKIIRERYPNGNYPARKSLQTEFAHTGGQNGLLFQLDAVAYRG